MCIRLCRWSQGVKGSPWQDPLLLRTHCSSLALCMGQHGREVHPPNMHAEPCTLNPDFRAHYLHVWQLQYVACPTFNVHLKFAAPKLFAMLELRSFKSCIGSYGLFGRARLSDALAGCSLLNQTSAGTLRHAKPLHC